MPSATIATIGPTKATNLFWLLLAVLTHALLIGVLPRINQWTTSAKTSSAVDFELVPVQVEEPSEPDIAAPLEEPEQAEEPPPQEWKTPKPPPKEIVPTPDEEPAAAKETPVAFDNVVLTNETGDGTWDVAPGSGIDSDAPIGSPDATITGASRDGVAGGAIGGTGTGRVTDIGDLSRRPSPPDLKSKLERNYPKKARSESKEGVAVVRLLIDANGDPRQIRILSDSAPEYGFGKACVLTLSGQRWPGAPVDASGRRVATRVTYTCRFTIRR